MLVLCYCFCHVSNVRLKTPPTVQLIRFVELDTWGFDAWRSAVVSVAMAQLRFFQKMDTVLQIKLPLF